MGPETLAIKISDKHKQSTNSHNSDSSKAQHDDQNVEAPHYAERTSWALSREACPPLEAAICSSWSAH
jgi:hypothetical protein